MLKGKQETNIDRAQRTRGEMIGEHSWGHNMLDFVSLRKAFTLSEMESHWRV